MSVIKEAFNVSARLSLPKVGENNLSVEVRVDDAAIRSQVPEFDGMESVFVLVPSEGSDGSVSWDRRPLEYRATQNTKDIHFAAFNQVDATAVARYGVAIGLESNGKTVEVWGQEAGDNYVAKVLQPPPRPRPVDQRLASMNTLVAAQGTRIMDHLDDASLVTFASAQAGLRDALAATDSTSDAGLTRIASSVASLLDIVQDKMWTNIDPKLRSALTSYERTLINLQSLIKNSL